jgi:hypothetical protein
MYIALTLSIGSMVHARCMLVENDSKAVPRLWTEMYWHDNSEVGLRLQFSYKRFYQGISEKTTNILSSAASRTRHVDSVRVEAAYVRCVGSTDSAMALVSTSILAIEEVIQESTLRSDKLAWSCSLQSFDSSSKNSRAEIRIRRSRCWCRRACQGCEDW